MTEQSRLHPRAVAPGAAGLRTYGELVRISPAAAPSLRPGAEGWVVDIVAATDALHYVVEFDDGAMVELPPHLVLDHGA